jgi:hypothetical protein
MQITGLLIPAKEHARIDTDEDDAGLLLMLETAARDVAHAAGIDLPETSDDLPEDLQFAVIDQAAMFYDARGVDMERPHGLSLAASRIVARHRGVGVGAADG